MFCDKAGGHYKLSFYEIVDYYEISKAFVLSKKETSQLLYVNFGWLRHLL